MGTLPKATPLTLEGPAGAIEALLETPSDGGPYGLAVVCHPHPLHGGTLTNKVTHTLARSFANAGFSVLRFNFRGVGNSAGSFDDGNGELDDALCAVDWLVAANPDLPLWLAGFSFGAAIAIRAAAARSAAGLVSVAPAVSRVAGSGEEQPGCPWLIVQGDQDELVNIDDTVAWIDSLEPGPELSIFEETEHFFHGKLVPLRETVAGFVARHHGE